MSSKNVSSVKGAFCTNEIDGALSWSAQPPNFNLHCFSLNVSTKKKVCFNRAQDVKNVKNKAKMTL